MKYVVISGASGGMGLATTRLLTNNGCYVFGLDIKEPSEKLDNYTFIKTDLRDLNSLNNAYLEVKKVTSEIDATISMAGIYDLNSLFIRDERRRFHPYL